MATKLDFIQCTQATYDTATKEIGCFYWVTDTQKLYLGEILINQSATALLEAAYPVGSIYMSVDDKSPSELFQFGTWARIENQFLLASGSNYSLGATGGNATTTLIKANLPASQWEFTMHAISSSAGGTTIADARSSTGDLSVGIIKDAFRSGGERTVSSGTQSIKSMNYNNGGSSQAFSNMPPYVAVNIWKRTA